MLWTVTSGTAPAPSPRLEGRFGRYEIERLLGQGGMGAVYLARQLDLERHVVIKVINPELASDPKVVGRLQREAKAAARIASDRVVQVFETGTENGVPFIAMEYVAGASLAQRLEERGRFRHAEATRLIIDAAEGLRAAHAVGVLHRDVKPANILLANDGRVKVADFGLAKLVNKAPADGTTLSVEGTILGTPDYMAPEQVRGEPLDGRADLYSLGVTYYELLCGRKPFRGDTPMMILANVLSGAVEPPREVVPDVPLGVQRACLALMARDRADRPADARAAIELLERSKKPSVSSFAARPPSGVEPATLAPARGAPTIQEASPFEANPVPEPVAAPGASGSRSSRSRSRLLLLLLALGLAGGGYWAYTTGRLAPLLKMLPALPGKKAPPKPAPARAPAGQAEQLAQKALDQATKMPDGPGRRDALELVASDFPGTAAALRAQQLLGTKRPAKNGKP